MIINKIPITLEGFQSLKKKLLFLQKNIRPKIINKISLARQYGDLKENAEYQTAKEEFFLLEKKIQLLLNKLKNLYIINININENNNKTVTFGKIVKLLNIKTNQILIYKIVGDDEADYKKNTISCNCPLAKSIIGKQLNEKVKVNTPLGIKIFKILNIA